MNLTYTGAIEQAMGKLKCDTVKTAISIYLAFV